MKKIMFNDRYGLTKAVLQGRKPITRRNADPKNKYVRYMINPSTDLPDGLYGYSEEKGWEHIKPMYKVGEVVAVAQPYKDVCNTPKGVKIGKPDTEDTKDAIRAAQCRARTNLTAWNNKMFVRADLMPHQIRITDIRIERLQDIYDKDCLREGIMEGQFINTWDTFYFDVIGDFPAHHTFPTAKKAFAALIDKVSGKGTWQRNPWVFVYEFELVK